MSKIELYPAPWDETLCLSCGYDPTDIWDGHDIVGTAWKWAIERKGHLCIECALASAHMLTVRYPHFTSWRG